MIAKFLIIAALLTILFMLGSAFYYMMRDQGKGKRTVRRLSWRVGLSVALLLMIMLALRLGWIQPGSSGPIRYPEPVTDSVGD
ncbi:MAG: twin transmembrane helix small protein [Xanthomonadales bacterium]|nr:twin transmembrane helix small protein [Gammaproteobacteria bacterium]NNE05851.1 twin transmembrane helix small protein [Xanthomonadales bacterium]NNL95229.1 twin transmembrane helix small protein [Xanthomonadales bacterium]